MKSSTRIAILPMPTKKRRSPPLPLSFLRTFLEWLASGEFDGSVKFDDDFPAHPSVASS